MNEDLHHFDAATSTLLTCWTDPSVCRALFQPAEPWRESTPPVSSTVWPLWIITLITRNLWDVKELSSMIHLISNSHTLHSATVWIVQKHPGQTKNSWIENLKCCTLDIHTQFCKLKDIEIFENWVLVLLVIFVNRGDTTATPGDWGLLHS